MAEGINISQGANDGAAGIIPYRPSTFGNDMANIYLRNRQLDESLKAKREAAKQKEEDQTQKQLEKYDLKPTPGVLPSTSQYFSNKAKEIHDFATENAYKLNDKAVQSQLNSMIVDYGTLGNLSKQYNDTLTNKSLSALRNQEIFTDETGLKHQTNTYDERLKNAKTPEELGAAFAEIGDEVAKVSSFKPLNDVPKEINAYADFAKQQAKENGHYSEFTDANGAVHKTGDWRFTKPEAEQFIRTTLAAPGKIQQINHIYNSLPEAEKNKYDDATDYWVKTVAPQITIQGGKTSNKEAPIGKGGKGAYSGNGWTNGQVNLNYIPEGRDLAKGSFAREQLDIYNKENPTNKKSSYVDLVGKEIYDKLQSIKNPLLEIAKTDATQNKPFDLEDEDGNIMAAKVQGVIKDNDGSYKILAYKDERDKKNPKKITTKAVFLPLDGSNEGKLNAE